jgi:hypothetical protein
MEKILNIGFSVVILMILISLGVVILAGMDNTNAVYLLNSEVVTNIYGTDYSLSNIDRGIKDFSVFSYDNSWVTFNGLNSYINVTNQEYLSINNTGQLTISFWLNIPDFDFNGTDGSGYIEIIGKGRTAWNNPEYGFRIYNNSNTANRPCRISFYVWNITGGEGAGMYAQNNITDTSCNVTMYGENWIHVVGDSNQTHVHLFVNNKTRADSTGNNLSFYNVTPTSGSSSLKFGSRQLVGYFNGSIDDIRIYNRTLTLAEISTIYELGRGANNTNTTGLIAQYDLNENNGKVIYDISGKANNASLIGGAKWANNGSQVIPAYTLDLSLNKLAFTDFAFNAKYMNYSYSYLHDTSNFAGMMDGFVLVIPLIIVLVIGTGVLILFINKQRRY